MFIAKLSPEFRLLLSCCRIIPGTKELKHREESIGESINEEIFFALVQRHRVLPIVYYNLQRENRISKDLKERLKKLAEDNQFNALQSRLMQHRIEKELKRKDFKGFFLKGVKLAELYYGDPGFRHVMDLDCWVEENAIMYLTEWLYKEGYVSVPDVRRLNAKQLAFIKRTDHDIQFLTEKAGLPQAIELHWKLRGSLGGFNLNPDKPMNEVDNFLYLCTHGTEHGWFRLKWLFDLPQVMDRVHFDWTQVRQRAIALDCLDHLEITMMVLDAFLNEPIPDAILADLEPHRYARQLRYIHDAIASTLVFNETDANRLGYLKYMNSLSRKKINGNLVLKYMTSHKDWELLPLPPDLFFLYFLLRPILIFWRRMFNIP